MSGTRQREDGGQGGHVWVRFQRDGRDYIFEAVARSPERIVRLFDEARQEYIPHAGVDHAFHQHAYAGYLRALE